MRAARLRLSTILLLTIVFSPFQSWAESAGDHVAEFQSGLLSVMKEAKALGVKGRFERLQPIIKRSFHLSLIAGLSAGPYWNQASSEQQTRLVSAFTNMSVATLATLFSGYSGEVFIVTGERPGPQGITFVDTSLKAPDRDKDVQISYVTRQFEGQWLIIDVIVDGGISELKVRISEYRQTLNTGGIEALITLLARKSDDLLS
ncbi:MAG: ABC transporter substrate-binding protein [Rhodospirillales bacterium]